MLPRKGARRRNALLGFLLGFLSVGGPTALVISMTVSAGNPAVWLGAVATATVGGGAVAWICRRRPAQGVGRGLLLALVAWTAAFTALVLILGAGILVVLLYFPFQVPMGCVIGAVVGRLLGPARPHPDKETVRRFEAVQTERARRRLTSPWRGSSL